MGITSAPATNMTAQQYRHFATMFDDETFNPREEEQRFLESHPTLNEEQRAFYDEVDRVCERAARELVEPQHRLFYLNGPGGSGKTRVLQTIIHRNRALGRIVLCSAWTGKASTFLSGGKTCHSQFGLSVPFDADNCATRLHAQ